MTSSGMNICKLCLTYLQIHLPMPTAIPASVTSVIRILHHEKMGEELSADPSYNDKAAMWKKVGPSKSQVTRTWTSIVKLTERKFTVSALQDADRFREQVQQKFEALSSIMDRFHENNEVIDQYRNKVETALNKLAKYMADNTVKVKEEGGASAPVNRGKERPPNKLLAPAILTKDDTPEKMWNWVTDFTTFLQSGDDLAIVTQQAYFRRLIDDHLRRAVEPHIMPNTPVLGKGGCLEILIAEFQVLYPIFARQVDFFKVNQAGSEDATSYLEKLTTLSLEANVNQLDRESITVFRFILSCSDQRLREKIFESKRRDLTEVRRIVSQHILQQRSESAIAEHVQAVANVKPKAKPRQFKIKMMEELKGRCLRCRKAPHKAEDCHVFRNKLTCHNCGLEGHISPVCMGGKGQNGPKRAPVNAVTEQEVSKSSLEATPRLPVIV